MPEAESQLALCPIILSMLISVAHSRGNYASRTLWVNCNASVFNSHPRSQGEIQTQVHPVAVMNINAVFALCWCVRVDNTNVRKDLIDSHPVKDLVTSTRLKGLNHAWMIIHEREKKNTSGKSEVWQIFTGVDLLCKWVSMLIVHSPAWKLCSLSVYSTPPI